MPQTVASGSGKAVLMNLEDGDHVWMCTATNEEGTDTMNVSFTGVCIYVHFCLMFLAASRLPRAALWILLCMDGGNQGLRH